MVDKLAQAGIVKSAINKEALLRVDRKNYVLKSTEDNAYEDSPLPIGYAATITAPHMHAHVLEDLLPPLLKASKDKPDKLLTILDVGCGSGYLTAVFGRMVEPKDRSTQLNEGKVFGIDVVPELVDMSKTNVMKEDGDLLDSHTVEFMVQDGWKGYPEGAPYNVIHVGAAAATFPKNLMMQLAPGGVMVVPVGPDGGTQYLYRVERVGDGGGVVGVDESKGFREGDFKVIRVLGVRYVPLKKV
jgi:protein-L-isoaspartate(D-aspartate) O-methyltransferase